MEVTCPRTFRCEPPHASFDIGRTPSYVSIASSSLSCLGSVLVLLTYLLLKDMRTGAQKVITMLAVADFFTAFGYIIGAANFLLHFNVMDDRKCVAFGTICSIQSFITTWSTMCSYCWTCILAFYFFVVIVFNRVQLAARLLPVYNVIAWLGPLLIIFPLLVLGKLGYAPYVASNWCYIKDTDYSSSLRKSWDMIVYILIAGKLWEVITYIFIMTLYIMIRIRITKTHKKIVDPHVQLAPKVVQVEKRLLAIPLLYILLRIWGTLQFFYSLAVAGTNQNGCIPKTVQIIFFVFGILQAVGDGAQGWCNSILYVFLSPKIRRRLFGLPFGNCLTIRSDNKIAHPIDSATTTPPFRNSMTSQPAAEFESARTVEIENKTSSQSECIPIRKAVGYKITRYTPTTPEATGASMRSGSIVTSGLMSTSTGGQTCFQTSLRSIHSIPTSPRSTQSVIV